MVGENGRIGIGRVGQHRGDRLERDRNGGGAELRILNSNWGLMINLHTPVLFFESVSAASVPVRIRASHFFIIDKRKEEEVHCMSPF